jgi:hypothetical protein
LVPSGDGSSGLHGYTYAGYNFCARQRARLSLNFSGRLRSRLSRFGRLIQTLFGGRQLKRCLNRTSKGGQTCGRKRSPSTRIFTNVPSTAEVIAKSIRMCGVRCTPGVLQSRRPARQPDFGGVRSSELLSCTVQLRLLIGSKTGPNGILSESELYTSCESLNKPDSERRYPIVSSTAWARKSLLLSGDPS